MSVPTLDEIARDNHRVNDLSPEVVSALLARCAAVQLALAAKIGRTPIIGESGAPERHLVQPGPLMTARDLAENLGVKESWIMSEARARRIPKRMVGRYVRFDAAEVRQALERRT